MFSEKEFKEALEVYQKDKSDMKSHEFYTLLKSNKYFNDITTKEDVIGQIESFLNIVSKMDRDKYKNRYIVQSFIMEFCRYLDKDFLFNITDSDTFHELKLKLKEFTGEVYNNSKKFVQTINQNSLEHLLEDYGALLKFKDLEGGEGEENKEEETTGMWAGNKLW